MIRHLHLASLAVALCSAMPAAAMSQSGAPQPAGATTDSTSQPPLQPGDVIRLRIWREQDLSGDFPVNASGYATLPKVGTIHVVDVSPRALRQQVLDTLERYLRNPAIEIVLLRRLNVAGGVKNPSIYLADDAMTISDVIALAGGATKQGVSHVRIYRDGRELPVQPIITAKITDIPLRSGDQIDVPNVSWFAQNGQLVYITMSTALTLITLLRSFR